MYEIKDPWGDIGRYNDDKPAIDKSVAVTAIDKLVDLIEGDEDDDKDNKKRKRKRLG